MSDLLVGRLLNQKEAAGYLGLSAKTFRRVVGVRPVLLPSGRGDKPLVRYRVSDLDAWVASVNDPKSRRKSA